MAKLVPDAMNDRWVYHREFWPYTPTGRIKKGYAETIAYAWLFFGGAEEEEDDQALQARRDPRFRHLVA
jgi:hypothetical protein